MVGDDQPRYWAKQDVVKRAQALSSSTNWKAAGEQYRLLLDEWKGIGRIDRATNDALWKEFTEARKTFQDRRQHYFDERERHQAAALAVKQGIIGRAQRAASANDMSAASEEMKHLLEEWKSAGRADRVAEDLLWAEFAKARKQLQDRRAREWEANKSAKERLVREAESLASSTDLKAASERMRTLGDSWRQIGPCDKADNERLCEQFNAARTRLHDRRTREFEKRKAESSANRAAKERITAQAESLAASSDLRTAGDAMRALADQWHSVGPCDKADNERLWARFNASRQRLRERKQQDFEARNAERQRRNQEYISRLEDQLYRVEAQLRNAEDAYSRALDARSPSMKNPNWYSISMRQQERQSNARSRIASLQLRRSDIITKLSNARSR